jgi:universal stress protein A
MHHPHDRFQDAVMQFQRILLPTDFSEHSAAATICACQLAGRLGAELHILHVLESHATATPQFGMGMVLPSRAHESKAAAEKMLAGVLDPHWAEGRTVIQAVTEGSPSDGIIRYAREHSIDLIIMSTHGRSGLAHVLVGSVSESVLRKAPCPVLTVRPTAFMDVTS